MTPGWMTQAACRGQTEVMFPADGDGRKQAAQRATALAVCRSCPVMMECRQWALSNYETHGIWGGLTASQRKRLAPYTVPCRECGRRFSRDDRPRSWYCTDLCLAESRRRARREYEAQKYVMADKYVSWKRRQETA